MLSSKFHQTRHHLWFVCWGCKSIVKKSAVRAANIFSHKQTGALSVNTTVNTLMSWVAFFRPHIMQHPLRSAKPITHFALIPITKIRSNIPANTCPLSNKNSSACSLEDSKKNVLLEKGTPQRKQDLHMQRVHIAYTKFRL